MAMPASKKDGYPHSDCVMAILGCVERDVVDSICDAMFKDLEDLCHFVKRTSAVRAHVYLEHRACRRYVGFVSSHYKLGWLADPVATRLHQRLLSKVTSGRIVDGVYVTNDGSYTLDRPDVHQPGFICLMKCID